MSNVRLRLAKQSQKAKLRLESACKDFKHVRPPALDQTQIAERALVLQRHKPIADWSRHRASERVTRFTNRLDAAGQGQGQRHGLRSKGGHGRSRKVGPIPAETYRRCSLRLYPPRLRRRLWRSACDRQGRIQGKEATKEKG